MSLVVTWTVINRKQSSKRDSFGAVTLDFLARMFDVRGRGDDQMSCRGRQDDVHCIKWYWEPSRVSVVLRRKQCEIGKEDGPRRCYEED